MAWLWCSCRVGCEHVKGAHGCYWCFISTPILPHMAITAHVITEDPFKAITPYGAPHAWLSINTCVHAKHTAGHSWCPVRATIAGFTDDGRVDDLPSARLNALKSDLLDIDPPTLWGMLRPKG
ncbi:hypothetical protein CJ030_MR3G018241 [Morella rubra]|uniref:Uncharacterized protein n=1 Tax=Morella rubra TaxID=262757 RepID=A0A6A1W0Y5_9ROSI|nr:hypothetical protein CJ030_MR3G018241 [Morella rubra]